MDPDGSGSIEFAEFRKYFVEPPPLFRNFDLHRRGAGEAEEEPSEEQEAMVALQDAPRLESRKKKFTLKAHPKT